ncbi:TonB-dependent receptor [bacterium]|nr:TonB-dependent receptor [bacterium]MCI0606401.1 TonB-dependent receptor [bacterium]
MNKKFFLIVVLGMIVFISAAFSQVSTKSGTIYGKVIDEDGGPLPGVSITIESDSTPAQMAISGPSGAFRFANLSPGKYSVTFSLEDFTELKHEAVQVSIGGSVNLEAKLKASFKDEITITIDDAELVSRTKTGNETTFSREYMQKVPSGRDPWTMIEQTPGIDNDRINIAGSESGQQTGFFTRGASFADNAWNYDGVNATDPIALGATPTYYDFDAFEEIQIQSGGMDASVGSKGVVVNLVTRRAGNRWEANASYYFVNDSLQSNNTPDELIALGVERSNRIDQVYDVGFDIGGPVIKDRLFAWAAWRRNQIDLFTRVTDPKTGESLSDKTKLTDLNLKVNFNANPANESQFAYFDGAKEKDGRGFDPPTQAQETLWQQGSPGTILEGIWTGQHTYIPNDHTIMNGRYGYIGLSFELSPNGGNCSAGAPCEVPMIFLAAIPHWEDTSFNVSPIDRPSHDFNADVNWFKEDWAGGDHEFKFGFEYKTSEGHTFSSYGNGALIIDYYQQTSGGPLISGGIYAQRFINGEMNYYRTSGYLIDTWRKDRLTLNLGFRVDSGSGENLAASIPAPAGFDEFISGVDFAGNDRSDVFTDISPRLGATYDITGDGKTVMRGNYARYYDGYTPFYNTYANPTYTYNGVVLYYTNLNGDRIITPNEIDSVGGYYGGAAPGPFNQNQFDSLRRIGDIESAVTDEFVVGFEREVVKDLALYVSFTHRTYDNFTQTVPFGVTAEDYVPASTFHFAHPDFGTFDIPYMDINFEHDGTQLLKTIDGYTQTYDGVDFGGRKRMSNNFMLNAFITLQRQKSHYDGGDSFFVVTGDGITARAVYADPSLVGFYDDQPYAFVSGGSGKTGVFPYAEWTFRASGIYQLPWDMSLGAFIRYQQGFPFPLFGQVSSGNLFLFYAPNDRLVLLEPIGERRYDNIFTLDFNLQKVFELSNYGRVTLGIDVFNVTNENTVVQRQRRVTTRTFNELQENLSPRAVRLGFKYSF